MTNVEVIKSLGIDLTGDVQKDNDLVNSAFGIGKPNKFVKRIKTIDGIKKVTLSPISFELGFCEQVWNKLDLGEKLRVMKWASEDYLQKNGYGTNFPSFVFFSEFDYDTIDYTALALDNKILLSLDYLNSCAGNNALVIILHESIHELDFKKITSIADNEISKYVFNYCGLANFRTLKEIIKLPIEGKIINWQSGQYENIDKELQQKIILVKNKIICLSRYTKTPANRHQVCTSDDLEKYIEASLYYSSPLENKAYNQSILHMFEISKNNSNKFKRSDKEIANILKYHKYLLNINGRKREIQKNYNLPLNKALNFELEHKFNKIYFKDNKEIYICKKDMEKRDEIVKRFWALKHAGKGECKEGAKEQIK